MKDLPKNLFESLKNGLQALEGKGLSLFKDSRERPAPAPRPLVKSRPVSLEQRYQLLDHPQLADEVFRRLQQTLFTAISSAERRGLIPAVFRETGRLHPGRAYFYIKPQSQQGWLFERSGSGWLLTLAEKIIARDLFLREELPLDQVLLYIAKEQVTMPRVKSRILGDDLLALSFYEQKLLQQLGLP